MHRNNVVGLNCVYVPPEHLPSMPIGALNTITSDVKPEPISLPNASSTGTGPFTVGHSSVINTPDTCVTPYYWNWYPNTFSYTSSWASIDKADNGFIVKVAGKTLICKTLEEIVELLAKEQNAR